MGMNEDKKGAKPEHMTTCSAYDLISEEDRETLRWVKDQGGIEHVKDLFYGNVQVSGDLAEWKREVYELCEFIGVRHEDCDGEECMLEKAYELLEKRLMPEGYEWPRFEDDDPVVPGNGKSRQGTNDYMCIAGVEILADGSFTLHGNQGPHPMHQTYKPSERVKRPQFIAADGEPMEVGQSVYGKDTGDRFEVSGFSHDCVVCYDVDKSESDIEILPGQLTHTKPEPPDSWEQIGKDIREMHDEWCSMPLIVQAIQKDAAVVGANTMGQALDKLADRCKALVGRDAS